MKAKCKRPKDIMVAAGTLSLCLVPAYSECAACTMISSAHFRPLHQKSSRTFVQELFSMLQFLVS